MKDIYKNPMLYYVLVPIVVALWPLLLWAVYLPRVESNLETEINHYKKAQKIITEILILDPERLDFADPNTASVEFDYAIAVERIASLYRIPSTDYKINSGMTRTSGGQKSQNANVVLKQIDITKSARFLSTLQLRWANLQCETVKLTRQKGLPDAWKVDLKFKYYY